jgi:WD40 repeat protein
MSNKQPKTNLNFKLSIKNSIKLSPQQQQQQSNQYNRAQNYNNNNNHKQKLNDIYLMQVCGNIKKSSKTIYKHSPVDFKLACLNSEQVITIYDECLNKKCQISDAHIDTIINEIDFFKCDRNLFLTCGDDSQVKCWDLRNPRKEVLKYDMTNDSEYGIKFLSLDIDCTDHLIASSTSNNVENNSYVYLFDIKMSNKVLKKYSDAHSNDITQVKFDSMNKNRLISASIDGLACVFDLANLKSDEQPRKRENESDNESVDEDDDLIDHVYNTNSSIQKIGYLNANNQYLYAITFTNDVFIWDLGTQDEVYKLSLHNSDKPSEYIIDCFNLNSAPNDIVTCLGDKHGNLQFYDLNERLIFNTSSIRAQNNKHHGDLIRSVFWNYYESELYSVGEDAILNRWKLDLVDGENDDDNNVKAGSSKRVMKNDEDDEEKDDDDVGNDKRKKQKIFNDYKNNDKKYFNNNKRKY